MAPSVVVTLGKQGRVYGDAQMVGGLEPYDVGPCVDNTVAGDAFVGVLAGHLS